jgi:hypothetical protein
VAFIAFDVEGRRRQVNLTIAEGDYVEIPAQEKKLSGADPVCQVNDAVDAFYLASVLLEVPELAFKGDGVIND